MFILGEKDILIGEAFGLFHDNSISITVSCISLKFIILMDPDCLQRSHHDGSGTDLSLLKKLKAAKPSVKSIYFMNSLKTETTLFKLGHSELKVCLLKLLQIHPPNIIKFYLQNSQLGISELGSKVFILLKYSLFGPCLPPENHFCEISRTTVEIMDL